MTHVENWLAVGTIEGLRGAEPLRAPCDGQATPCPGQVAGHSQAVLRLFTLAHPGQCYAQGQRRVQVGWIWTERSTIFGLSEVQFLPQRVPEWPHSFP